jgi:hypothetical protein
MQSNLRCRSDHGTNFVPTPSARRADIGVDDAMGGVLDPIVPAARAARAQGNY